MQSAASSALHVVRRAAPLAARRPRTVCSASGSAATTPDTGDAPAVPKRKPKKVRKPDLPHVVRRHEYEKSMSRARIAFADEATTNLTAASEAEAAARDAFARDKSARAEKRAVRSAAAFATALEARAAQAVRREERRAIGLQTWAARRKAEDVRRRSRVEVLNAVAADWITEENLAEKVDDLLDQWFINSEAAEHAQRGFAVKTESEPTRAAA